MVLFRITIMAKKCENNMRNLKYNCRPGIAYLQLQFNILENREIETKINEGLKQEHSVQSTCFKFNCCCTFHKQ